METRSGRLRRWLRLFSIGLAGLVVFVIVAVLVVLGNLDRPPLKRRVQKLARTSAGVDIDYRSVRIGIFSGAEIEGLVVQSPAETRAVAPDLVRVGLIAARWSLGSIFGHGAAVERLAISDVTLTVVVDEHGRTSFDELSGPSPSPPSAPLPLSRRAAILNSAPPVGQIEIEHVILALVRTEAGAVSERTELRGLGFTMSAEPVAKGGWRVAAGLGSAAAPLDLGITREQGGASAGGGHAKVWLALDATSSALTAALDLRVLEQTFAPDVSGNESLHAEASVKFDPSAGRTEIAVTHTEAGDGVATAEASIEIPDVGDPLVRHAHGDVDGTRLLASVPAGLVPLTAERAHVRYQIDSLVAGPAPRVSEGGALALDADLSNVSVHLADGPLEVGSGKLSFHAEPGPSGEIVGRGAIALAGIRLESGGDRVKVDDLAIDLDGAQAKGGAVTGHAGVRFARFARAGASPVVARDGRLDLRAQNLFADVAAPLATRGDLALSVDVASIDARLPSLHATVDGLALHAHTLLEGQAPYAIEVEAPIARLRARADDGRLLVDAPARIEARIHDASLDAARPAASRAKGQITIDLGELHATLDATKGDDFVDFVLHAAAPSLKMARPFLSPELAEKAPWERIGVDLRSSGRAEHLGGALSIRQKTELVALHPAFETVAARSVSLVVESRGDLLRHHADVDLHAEGLAFDGGAASDDHVKLSATLDRVHPSLHVEVDTDGRATTKLSASLSFDPSSHAVPYQIDAHLAGLAALAPFVAKVHGMEGIDLSQLELGFSAGGTLLGVVESVGRDGVVDLAPHPTRTAAVEGKMELRASHFRWTHGDTEIVGPAIAWRAGLRAEGARRTVESDLDVDSLHLDLGANEVSLAGINDKTSVTVTGDLLDPEAQVSQHVAIRTVEQDAVPDYPVGDVTFALSAEREPDGLVHVSDLKLMNGAGGTTLDLNGGVELAAARRRLSFTTELSQDLSRLSKTPARFTGRGNVVVQASVTSPDLDLFRTRGTLKADDVSIRLPRAGVEVESFKGEVPITVALEIGAHGVELRRDEKRSPYSMLRFADQHPLLNRSGFLSIASIKTPFVTIAPLVGNLEIEQNLVSLRQFELGVHDGTISGQCAVDWDGPRSTVELHVRATGVKSSHGEPFDGNIAVAIAAGDRTIVGRAEILRIGPRHLLDLLALEDPMHVDPTINRIRTALSLGYPDRLRLVFDRGFASARIELGGLARLVTIDEIRGIPMGPLIDNLLSPMLDPKGEP